ncbi:hypothetical protein DES45_10779 [Microvirga subterranea]|uniref:Metal-binding protein n=1 Tax=Microvirga subterranea TaxID=186651 RepID=A0A370HHQ9_9HYPH|nr:hypothetical protein DES45_10779 [Microvirga subterranea]
MQPNLTISRRALLVGLAAAPLALSALPVVAAQSLPKMTVTKDPSCGCCGAWVDHVRKAGFPVEVIESAEVNRLKVRLGVPQALASCHTAEIGGYVVEGHVPADAIKRLLAERPQAKGLAVPGMPVGSPGHGGRGRRGRHLRRRPVRARRPDDVRALPGQSPGLMPRVAGSCPAKDMP